jgi:hypothetical protein
MNEETDPCPSDSPSQPEQPTERDARSERVGELLRNIYGEAAAEPVPDMFEDLLRKLG